MTICPLCGRSNAEDALICEACGNQLRIEELPRQKKRRFFTPLPAFLMLGVPTILIALLRLIVWFDNRNALGGISDDAKVAILLGIWASAALSSAIGWTLAALRRWGFKPLRLALLSCFGLVAGAVLWIAGWAAVLEFTDIE